jgi:hypothetical protein
MMALEAYVGHSKYVVLNDAQSWCYAFLLDLKPVSYQFYCKDKGVIGKIKNLQSEELFVIEEQRVPLDKTFWTELERQTSWRVESSRQFCENKTAYRVVRK